MKNVHEKSSISIIIKQNASTDTVTVDGVVFDLSKMDTKERNKFRVDLVKGVRDLGMVKK